MKYPVFFLFTLILLVAAPLPVIAVDLEAGPIWSNADAQSKCPAVCDPSGSWHGQWVTTIQGKMSVCGCNVVGPYTLDIEVGPIWNNSDAQDKCQNACSRYGTWNGHWKTTVPGAMSVCGCRFTPEHLKDWTKKTLDDSRGNCNYTKGQCVSGSDKNCWICDDQDRDHLDMTLTGSTSYVTELKKDVRLPTDGRYIYVYRGTDDKFLLRPFDRAVSSSSCTTLYNKSRYSDNYKDGSYMHVRHSQLNGGWDPLWSAGELKIWDRKITVINNESGHFKPTVANVQQAVNALKAWNIPGANSVSWGDFKDHSANLSDSECKSIIGHEEL